MPSLLSAQRQVGRTGLQSSCVGYSRSTRHERVRDVTAESLSDSLSAGLLRCMRQVQSGLGAAPISVNRPASRSWSSSSMSC